MSPGDNGALSSQREMPFPLEAEANLDLCSHSLPGQPYSAAEDALDLLTLPPLSPTSGIKGVYHAQFMRC